MVEQASEDFFKRHALDPDDEGVCLDFARFHYPDHTVQASKRQGYCSYTLAVSAPESLRPTHIVQFRPRQYKLDIDIARDAKAQYDALAPRTRLLGPLLMRPPGNEHLEMLVYEFEVIEGTPYSCISHEASLAFDPKLARQMRLIADFARFISLGWTAGASTYKHEWCLLQGPVGSTLVSRVQALCESLPSSDLRIHASRAYGSLDKFNLLPVVLTHGDLVPSNLMVDEKSGSLMGLVDWAEAEYLPFGMCLYGLEYLLGHLDADKHTFTYFMHAERLRQIFWKTVMDAIPLLRTDSGLLSAVQVARDVGVMLWFGFAFDDGKIDRVVDERKDQTEVMLLRTFLSAGSGVFAEDSCHSIYPNMAGRSNL